MKILQILGAVVAIHLLAFIFIFASPGCQSTPKNIPTPDATLPPGAATASAVSYSSGAMAAEPAPVDLGTAGAPITFNPSLPTGRAAPTRPGSPAAAAVTPPKPIAADIAPVSTYTVAKGDSLWTIAKKHGLSVNELAKANNLGAGVALQPGRKLIIPGKPGAASATVLALPDAANPAGEGQTYKVQAGDSLAGIAKKHGATVAALKAANNLASDTVRPGQELRLPAGTKTTPAEPAVLAASTFAANGVKGAGEPLTHTVQLGESLGVIARKYQITVGELATTNNITDPGKVRAGQKLVIPGFKAVGDAKGGKSAAAGVTVPETTPAAGASALHFEIKPPPPGQDLDSGLKNTGAEVPTIKIEEPKDSTNPPKGN